jgi:hypothetical protein
MTNHIHLLIGIAANRMAGFHAVVYNAGHGSTTSIGDTTARASFAWQGFAGLRVQPSGSRVSMDIAYRY